jgi:hypothetical protein
MTGFFEAPHDIGHLFPAVMIQAPSLYFEQSFFVEFLSIKHNTW